MILVVMMMVMVGMIDVSTASVERTGIRAAEQRKVSIVSRLERLSQPLEDVVLCCCLMVIRWLCLLMVMVLLLLLLLVMLLLLLMGLVTVVARNQQMISRHWTTTVATGTTAATTTTVSVRWTDASRSDGTTCQPGRVIDIHRYRVGGGW